MILIAATGLGGAVASLAAGITQGGLGIAVVLALMLIGAGALFLLYALRSRIVLSPDALEIFSLASHHRIAWEDITGADPGYDGIDIAVEGGAVIGAGAVQKSNASRWLGRTDTRADRVAREIMDRADAARR